jgi:hypothetical protein
LIECSWLSTFGIECPTCGFQRSVVLLFEGDIVGSIYMFPATIPFLLCVVVAGFSVFGKFKNGPNWVVGLFSLTAVLIVVNYVFKIANGSILEHVHF